MKSRPLMLVAAALVFVSLSGFRAADVSGKCTATFTTDIGEQHQLASCGMHQPTPRPLRATRSRVFGAFCRNSAAAAGPHDPAMYGWIGTSASRQADT